MLPCQIWSFCVKRRTHKYRKTPNIAGALELRPLRMGGVAEPKIHAPLRHVLPRHVKFGSSATKGVRINRKEPPKLGSAWAQPPCGRGVGGPLKYTSPHVGYPAEFGRSTNGMSVIKEIRLKILTLVRVSPSKVIQCRRNRHITFHIATMDLFVPFPR